MSDVYSFGVVLLELITGKKSVDKKRPSREHDLVEWARPLLKDSHKLERIIDPRLEDQYSIEGARKLSSLAYQCLSHNAKNRPTMRNVVKTLEPLLELKDIPIGHFVYVVPNEESFKVEQKGGENDHDEINKGEVKIKEEEKEEKGDKNEKGRQRLRKKRGNRRQIKPLRSRAGYSDTALYKTLGTSLYSPKQATQRDDQY